ncbi:MAG: Gfo/Idh/MocA family oxidoreductase [Alphaproteobacteria bacterium]|nr:Gfo/Idh/MocA family oxidoreductase [Alphaproteobacteria bacterium]MBU1560691.1 Gfo/Idh/MocA family oxidoreductase [Alphaproteobacteria bacterium]MBU2301925.1 Gfo/Idh/MocA family oxidoreductase [Alphaproteobacteria bacterium]MBU2368975.1 Gfo/Idh/MocA family oxidoreductase [Alphaproteobacteria bacterium]
MPFRAVLAGCGSMSKGWLSAIAEHPLLKGRIDIVGLVDLHLPTAQARAAEFGLSEIAIGTDLDAVLATTRPDLLFDVVVPSAREDVVTTGLRHGCHVLSEKPMAATLAAGQALIAQAKAAGRVHAVVQNRRFISGIRRIRRLIESGALGEITALHCDFFIGAHFGGFRDEMEHVLLLDMAIHTLDAARFMAGVAPRAVYCLETNPRGSWYAHGAAANAIFEFDDGIVFNYRGSWCAEGANTSWESAWRIIGTKGTLTWDGEDAFEARTVVGDTGFFRDLQAIEVPAPADIDQTHGHASVIAEFLDAIEEGRSPETASNDNIKSLAMVFAAIESARTRQRVLIAV